MKYDALLQTIKQQMMNAKKWQKPFQFLDGYAYNALTGKKLIGISQLVASAEKQSKDYQHNLWLTYSQAMQLCGFEWQDGQYVFKADGEAPQPLKGQKSTKFIYAKPPLYEAEGKLKKYQHLSVTDKQLVDDGFKEAIWTYGLLSYFNIEQIQCPFDHSKVKYPEAKLDLKDNQPIPEIEEWIRKTGVPVKTYENINPCYAPASDAVCMLPISNFKTSADYYATFFHELGHATMHPTRLNRKHDYAHEELVAELVSSFKCADFGFSSNLQHAEYLSFWANLIEDNPNAFNQAIAEAFKAVKFLDEQASKADSFENSSITKIITVA